MAYATSSDVQARDPYRPISATTSPTTTQVTQWLTEADALLNGALQAGQISTPVTSANGLEILKSWACDYGEGHLRMAYAASGGDGSNTDGRDLLEKFYKILEDILDNPARYGAMLQGGTAGSSARRLRGHVLDNADNLTVEAGDFAPKVTKDEVF